MTTLKGRDVVFEIGGFVFSPKGAKPADKVTPTVQGWQAAFVFAGDAERSSPLWLADLLNYADTRQDWQEKLDQIKSVTGHAHQTLLNIAHVGRRVQGKAREIAPTFSHMKAVASLEYADQVKVLERARDEELTVSQTSKLAKRITRPRIIDGQAELRGRYRVILADPPWSYDNNTAMPDGSLTPAESSYEGMSIEQICALPVAAHTLPDAVLFLWSTNSHLLENPGPREVIEAWGFTYKTNYVWDKVLGRPGHYSYSMHEVLIVATRGACTPDVPILKHDHASIQRFKRTGEHSQKPDEWRKLIENLYPDGPYLELFGRKRVKGWSVFGNDARLWKAS